MTADRTVLVTGAAGALGRRMLGLLAKRGWRTRALIHRRPVEGATEVVGGDLADPSSLDRAVSGVDAVLHLAAVTHARSSRAYARANVEGTRSLLAAVKRRNVERFVQVSTRAIAEDGGGYSRSKRRAEELVRSAGVQFVIVRLPEVYGAGREGIDELVERVARGARVAVVGDGSDVLCPIHVDDAAAALAAALDAEAAPGKTYTLAGPPVSVAALAEAVAARSGRHARLVRVPIPILAVAGALAHVLPLPLYPDQVRRLRSPKPPASPEAARELGFRARPLELQ